MSRIYRTIHPGNPLLIFLFSCLFFISCSQTKNEAPENVCTLTPEQIPEVRGFRLGMTYDEIKKRFPNLCPIPMDEPIIRLDIKKASEYVAPRKSGECSSSVNLENYPELGGLFAMRLTFNKDQKVAGLSIAYEQTTDKDFNFTFRQKTKEALGLSQFTNWAFVSNVLAKNRNEFRLEAQQLICNKVQILVGTQDYKWEMPPYSIPILEISYSDEIAKTKGQTEQEKKAAEEKKKAEEKEKRDAFKP